MVMLENGLREAMNARITGSGTEAIVLAHGYGGDQSVWDKIIPSLANHYRVLVFDWNFSGSVKDPNNSFDPCKHSSYETFATDLIRLMDEMEIKSSVFVGHSMSGMIGCIASVKRPDLFKRLVLVGASPRYINTEDYEGGFKNSDIETIISEIETNFHNWAPTFATLVVGGNDPLCVATFCSSLQNMRPEVALSVAKTVFHSDEREVLERVVTPCTIVQTNHDIVVPNSVSYFMKEKIKGKCTVEIIDVDGHFPQLTAPLQLLQVICGVMGS